MNDNDRLAAGILIGLGVGLGLGLLFAPRAGRSTRRAIRHAAEDGVEYLENKTRDLRDQAEDLIAGGREALGRQKARGATALQS